MVANQTTLAAMLEAGFGTLLQLQLATLYSANPKADLNCRESGPRSASGHSRRLGLVGDMSGLPQTADISGPGRHFAFVQARPASGFSSRKSRDGSGFAKCSLRVKRDRSHSATLRAKSAVIKKLT